MEKQKEVEKCLDEMFSRIIDQEEMVLKAVHLFEQVREPPENLLEDRCAYFS